MDVPSIHAPAYFQNLTSSIANKKSGTPWRPAVVCCVCWPCSAGGSSQVVRVSRPCEGGGDVVEPFNGLVDGGDGLLALSP